MKTKVMVVGLLPEQMRRVEKACDGLKILFHHAGQACRTFPYADHVVLMTRWINHREWNRFQKRYDRSQVKVVHGGMTELLTTLQGLSPASEKVKR